MKYLNKEQLKSSLEVKDLTEDDSHAIGILTNSIIDKLQIKYGKADTIRKSPIVSVEDNYDKLYYPQDTVTKSSRYTRWIDGNTLLRTHMTSSIPSVLEQLNTDDNLLVCPGIVYRRDIVDKTHVGEPHQMDVWKVTKDKIYTREDLLDLVQTIIDAILPDIEWRYNETSHYYTKDGIEVEALIRGEWLEILECGLALPELLEASGLNGWSGLALGIGLDRAVMIRKNIGDIRTLRSDNPRIKKQMLDLSEYVDVSTQPAIVRDMSIAVYTNNDIEQIGDSIRELMGSDVNIIEQIDVKSEWEYSELPKHVCERLGMTPDMKNMLLSVTIRPLDRSMTRSEANEIYDLLYDNIHCSDVGYYIK